VILQLTDVHLDTFYKVGSLATCVQEAAISYPCCNGGWPIPAFGVKKRYAGKWGDYWCDTPEELLSLAMSNIQEAGVEGIDAVIWTGDSPGHNDFSQSRSRNVESVLKVTQALSAVFDPAGVPIIPALGNHGAFPVDNLQDAPHNQWLIGPLVSAWQRYIPTDQLKVFNESGYFEVPLPSMRVPTVAIVLSTTYFDRHNFLPHSSGEKEQLSWLKTRLTAARSAGQRVYLVGHIYPGNGEADATFTTTYLSLASAFSDIIVHHIYGHAHTDGFQILERPGGEGERDKVGAGASGIAYISPSITPFGKVNPSYRYFIVNRTTSTFIDFLDYSLNLTAANSLPVGTVPEFAFYYQASLNLSLPDQSVASYRRLLTRLAADESFFTYFYTQIYHVGADPVEAHYDTCSTQKCRQQFICQFNSTMHQGC
jgi:hypothetical protein